MPTSRRHRVNQGARRPLALALIGTGRWGLVIARTLATLPDARLVATATRDWRKLLTRRLDGVLVATPAATHAAIALPFLRRGVPTFIEKPLATNLRDAYRIADAARHADGLVIVGHLHLYSGAYAALRRVVRRRAGRIRLVVSEGMSAGPVRPDCSVLWDWGPHDVSLTLDLLGELPRTVRAWGIVCRPRARQADHVMLRLTFPSGIESFHTLSWRSPIKRRSLTVVGERATVVYDDTADRKLVVFPPGKTPAYPRYDSTPPLTRELAAFLRMIRTRRPPAPTDLASGLSVIRVLATAERSVARAGNAQGLRGL